MSFGILWKKKNALSFRILSKKKNCIAIRKFAKWGVSAPIICAACSTWPAIQVIVTLRCVAPGAIICCATDTQEEHANRQKSRLKVNRKSRPQEPKRQQPTSSWNDQKVSKWKLNSPGVYVEIVQFDWCKEVFKTKCRLLVSCHCHRWLGQIVAKNETPGVNGGFNNCFNRRVSTNMHA